MRSLQLNKIATFRHGGTPTRSEKSYWMGGIPWFSPKDMRNFVADVSQETVSEEAISKGRVSLVPRSTILVVVRSGILRRKLPVAITNKEVTFNQDIKAIIPNEQLCDSEYLAYFLIGNEATILSEGIKVGPTVHSFKSGFFDSLLIPLPDLPTQRRIAARLKAQLAEVDAARQAAEASRTDADKLLEHYLRESFEGIVPLSTNPLNPVTPKGWVWAPLIDLARLESGHTPSRRHPEYWENGDIPWLALPDIRALDCQVALETSEQTNRLGITNSSARILPPDTVALSRTASVGFVTIFGREMATSQDFVNWICGEQLVPRFLMWLLRASRKLIREVSTGAIHKTVYMDVVHNFHICLPPIEKQREIAAKLDALQEEIQTLSRKQTDQLEALNRLPAAYLREAFSP